MNYYINFFLALLISIINGCISPSESTNKKLKIIEDIDINIEDEKVLADQRIEEEFKLTDENVINFLFEYEKNNKENKVRIYTNFGNIDILLFSNTPYHRSNFIYLTKKNYFEGTQFYRVVNDFVIQAGNSDNRKISSKRQRIGKYLLPNDFNKGHTHKRGMVSMPSSSIDNPYKMASPYEFFIVQKKDGAHHLDGNYTIFGTVIKGMEVVDIIANLPTDERDWPLNNVYINRIEIFN